MQRRLEYISNEKAALQTKLDNTIAKLTAEYESMKNKLDTEITNKTGDKLALEQELASASFFAFGLKNRLKTEIEATKNRLEELEKERVELYVNHRERMEIEKDNVIKEINKLPQKANTRFPMPK